MSVPGAGKRIQAELRCNMRIVQTDRSRILPWISSIPAALAQLLIAGLIGALSFVVMDRLAPEAFVLSGIVALAVVVAITWQQARADARKRFLAALDAYADRESSRSPAPPTESEWFLPRN